MARLLLFNGPPGIGKSTLARRWAAAHPPTLCCDIDVLRGFIGGWEADFAAAGALVRPAALALIGAYLAGGNDVVLPQLLLDPAEIARFSAAATDQGAAFEHIVLVDEPASVVARFDARGGDGDPWHDRVRVIVADQGGDVALLRWCAALDALAGDVRRVPTRAGDLDGSYDALVAAVDG